MIIKVLGSGCKKCLKLEDNVKEALKNENQEAEIQKVTDIMEISNYNVMNTPALVIDEKVVSFGKVNTIEEVQSFLEA